MIQKPRPWVATTRSSSLISRSVTGTVGSSFWKGAQLAPSSSDAYTPRSEPAKSRPRR